MGRFYDYIEKQIKSNEKQKSNNDFDEFLQAAEIDGFKLLGCGSIVTNETCQRLYDLKLKNKIVNELKMMNNILAAILQSLQDG